VILLTVLVTAVLLATVLVDAVLVDTVLVTAVRVLLSQRVLLLMLVPQSPKVHGYKPIDTEASQRVSDSEHRQDDACLSLP
jgi:hypothetical protein